MRGLCALSCVFVRFFLIYFLKYFLNGNTRRDGRIYVISGVWVPSKHGA